jgi:hypothetical protein
MVRTGSFRLFLLLLLAVTIPILLSGTGSGRAEDGDKGKNQAAVRLVKIIPVPVSGLNTTAGAL